MPPTDGGHVGCNINNEKVPPSFEKTFDIKRASGKIETVF